jgi:hypothetical protein
MKNVKIIVPIICVLVGLGVGFLGGVEYKNYQAKKLRNNFTTSGTNGNFQRFTGGTRVAGQNGNGMMRGGAIEGTILSMDDKSVTVKIADGSSKIVLFSSSTTYSNTAAASKGDLKVGNTIAVFGAANSDGSVTATNVQINPVNFRPQGTPSPK